MIKIAIAIADAFSFWCFWRGSKIIDEQLERIVRLGGRSFDSNVEHIITRRRRNFRFWDRYRTPQLKVNYRFWGFYEIHKIISGCRLHLIFADRTTVEFSPNAHVLGTRNNTGPSLASVFKEVFGPQKKFEVDKLCCIVIEKWTELHSVPREEFLICQYRLSFARDESNDQPFLVNRHLLVLDKPHGAIARIVAKDR